MTRTAVSILGGFLGAGKTTVVNHLLRHGSVGTLVLVNDFGAVDIDGQLINARQGDVLSLVNGCACCTIGPDLSATLARMLDRRPPPARIIIEASGVSDPWRIAQLVKLERSAELVAVVVVADSLTFHCQATDRWLADTLSRQVARADIIALTKCDIASEKMKADTRAAIASMRADVPVIEVAHGCLPEAVISAGTAHEASRLLADVPEHGFRSWHWAPSCPLIRNRLEVTLDSLPTSVLRAKGVIRLGENGMYQRHVLQLVGRRWTLERSRGPEFEDRLVVIGTDDMPEFEQLEASFSRCLDDAMA